MCCYYEKKMGNYGKEKRAYFISSLNLEISEST